MNKLTLLWILLIGLLAANILLAGALYRNKHHRHEGPKNHIIAQLHLDESQIARYEPLIEAHRKAIGEKQKSIMQLKNELYNCLKYETGDTDFVARADSLMTVINQIQMDMERVNYAHFRDIKKLCRPEQISYFDDLCTDIAHLFAPQRPPN